MLFCITSDYCKILRVIKHNRSLDLGNGSNKFGNHCFRASLYKHTSLLSCNHSQLKEVFRQLKYLVIGVNFIQRLCSPIGIIIAGLHIWTTSYQKAWKSGTKRGSAEKLYPSTESSSESHIWHANLAATTPLPEEQQKTPASISLFKTTEQKSFILKTKIQTLYFCDSYKTIENFAFSFTCWYEDGEAISAAPGNEVYGALLSVAGSKYVGANADKVPCLYDCTAKYVRPPCKLNNTEIQNTHAKLFQVFISGNLIGVGIGSRLFRHVLMHAFQGGKAKRFQKHLKKEFCRVLILKGFQKA